MFCPQCRIEYREGFTECADCHAALVAELPEVSPPPTAEYLDYEQLLETYNPVDVALIRSLLDAENIKYYFLGEIFYTLSPFLEPARLMVSKEHVATARDILRDVDLRYSISF